MSSQATASISAEKARVDELVGALQDLARAKRLSEVGRIVRGAARRLTSADGVTLALRAGDDCHYIDEDAITPLWKGHRIPLGECASGWVMLNHREAVIDDVYADDEVPSEPFRSTFVASAAAIPFGVGEPVGAIGAYWAERHQATEEELKLLRVLGDATASALTHVSVNEDSQTDELTGLNTRRGFFEIALEAFRGELARGGECAAVFVDLDGLHRVNDDYGHHAGSELIREAAAALVAISDEGDILGRLGGDELALFRAGGASSAAELQSAIAFAVTRASRSDRPFGLEVNVGVAVAPAAEVGTLDGLLTRADLAMTAHKHIEGRHAHVRRGVR